MSNNEPARPLADRIRDRYPCWCGHFCGQPWDHEANPPLPKRLGGDDTWAALP